MTSGVTHQELMKFPQYTHQYHRNFFNLAASKHDFD